MSLLGRFRPVIYAAIHPDELRLRHVQSGRLIAERPVVAQSAKGKFLAAGQQAERLAGQPDIKICNPFRHPRMAIADFDSAEYLFKNFTRRLFRSSLVMAAPITVLHLRSNPRGGFAQVEIRAFAELAVGIGAKKTVVWQGQVPTDEELLSLEFRGSGCTLSF